MRSRRQIGCRCPQIAIPKNPHNEQLQPEGKARLEAFSDGAIATTVLEMKGPHNTGLAAIWQLTSGFGS